MLLFVVMRKNGAYHHGNLRESLLGAAVDLIAEVGPSGFTLREVARRAGVSHNAPYRHFSDRDDLMAAVASQGFAQLAAEMKKAAELETEPVRRLKQAGLAYVSFALSRPEHFAVMFDAPVSISKNPGCAESSEKAFGVLRQLVNDCQQKGALPPGDSLDRALLSWSVVHGIAKLAIGGRLPFKTKAKVLRFAEFVIDERR